MVSRDIWIPLFESALIAFPKWSQTSLALFTIWNSIMGVLFMTPACGFINKFGKKYSHYLKKKPSLLYLQFKLPNESIE